MNHVVLTGSLHRTHRLNTGALAMFAIAATLVALAVRICTSWLMVPVAWSLVSVATAIVLCTVAHGNHHASEYAAE